MKTCVINCNANTRCNRASGFSSAVSVSRYPSCNFFCSPYPSLHHDYYSHMGCLGIKKIDSPPATISLSLLFSRALLSSLFPSFYTSTSLTNENFDLFFFLQIFIAYFSAQKQRSNLRNSREIQTREYKMNI